MARRSKLDTALIVARILTALARILEVLDRWW